MKTRYRILLLILGIFFTTKAQHIIKPNGDAAAKPNLPKVKKINLANAQNLRVLGKTSNEIAKILKEGHSSATDVFGSLKPTTPDAENVEALCFAGFSAYDIAEALKTEGKTPLETTELLKNSRNCAFDRITVLKAIQFTYRIRLKDLVPIIQEKYTIITTEIVDCLIGVLHIEDEVISAIAYNRMANNRRELCVLLNRKFPRFNKENLWNVFKVLRRTSLGTVDIDYDTADSLLYFEATPLQVLDIFFTQYYLRPTPESALRLARIGKYLNIPRNDVAEFMRSKSYTANQILDALQAHYGS